MGGKVHRQTSRRKRDCGSSGATDSWKEENQSDTWIMAAKRDSLECWWMVTIPIRLWCTNSTGVFIMDVPAIFPSNVMRCRREGAIDRLRNVTRRPRQRNRNWKVWGIASKCNGSAIGIGKSRMTPPSPSL